MTNEQVRRRLLRTWAACWSIYSDTAAKQQGWHVAASLRQ